MPPDKVVDTMLQNLGVIGVLMLAAGLAIRSLHGQLTSSQESRTQDAQKVTSTILQLVGEHNAIKEKLTIALTENTNAMREHTDAIERQTQALEELRRKVER